MESLAEKYFYKICSIPHPSYHEKALSDYVVSEAKQLGYEYIQDEMWNVIVKIPATKGYEDVPAIMVSGHMDMVPTKLAEKEFNFETDPIEYYLDGRILRANGTTLGADDGVATAYMLALMHDSFEHPLIECVFTVQEETGCDGAKFVDASKLTAKKLIGLDTTGEYEVTVGNYCSDLIIFKKDISFIEEKKKGYLVKLKTIDSYYGGFDVHDYTKNAIQYLSKILKDHHCCLVSMHGGKAENLPVQDAEAVVVCEESLEGINEITYYEVEADHYLSQEASNQLYDFLLSIPNGALESEGETLLSSFLLGKITLENSIEILGSSRAKNNEYNEHVLTILKQLKDEYQYNYEQSVRYRSWDYRPYSPLRELFRKALKTRTDQDVVETICPGGLEISDFIYKMGDIDVLSIGPKAGGFHTPSEWMNIDSFNLVYELLKDVIKAK